LVEPVSSTLVTEKGSGQPLPEDGVAADALTAPGYGPVLQKILIANRGEIAVRVIRACRELGIGSVAVYSELDRNALHVRLADEAYALGGQTAAESYLNTDAILDAVAKSGADGVHPGYGFFSENADFARAITERGVVFIGPPPAAIVEMGDKVSSRLAAMRGGVACVPGTTEFVTDASQVHAFGEASGWPIAIKAAYGGGGRGMKVVSGPGEVEAAIESARREAKAYFGRDEIYLERYLTWPRHIEMQIVGDQQGDVVWISERDCSAQRRHQKLVEESPAPAFPEDLRRAMGDAAVKVAKAVGYTNAGTVEFIFQDGEFFFLEMNTRLQVEHPVTEMVTGIDLVEWQVRVASGEPLPMSQEEVLAQRRGHAIEIRINAENPAGGRFLPSPGTITRLTPADGFGTRFDGGYESGDTISQYYDNLIGKLIVWGRDRPVAIARAIRALEEMVVEGVATTIPADLAILRHPDFQQATHSTKWVEERLDLSGVEAPKAPQPSEDGAPPLVERSTTVEVDGKRFSVTLWVPESAPATVSGGGPAPAVRRPARAAAAGAGGAGSGEVAVPMQGTIVKVLVEVGAAVEAGQPVVVLEAMKMENQIQAETTGTVSQVKVAPGDTVGAGDVVVVIS
jgi:acetyl-CoA/propionyl-CoA carboxylase biotin carboxyl carrier protein